MSRAACVQPIRASNQRAVWKIGIVSLALILLSYLNPLLLPLNALLSVTAAKLILAAAWIAWKLSRNQALPATPLDVPLMLVLLVSVISTSLSAQPQLGLDSLAEWLSLAFLFYVVVDRLLSGWSHEIIVNSMLLAGTVILVDSLWRVFQWFVERWYDLAPGYPLIAMSYRIFNIIPANHPNQLVAVVYLLLPFGIRRLWLAHSIGVRSIWAIWLLATELVIFFTGSRGGWVGAATALVVYVGLILVRDGVPSIAHFRAWFARHSRLLLATGTYLLFFGVLVGTQSQQLSTNRSGLTNLSGRQVFWQHALTLFAQHPFVGSGPGSYGPHYASFASGSYQFIAAHAHNWLLNTLAQMGLLGALALLGVFGVGIVAFATGVRRRHDVSQQSQLYACCAAWAGLLVHMLVDIPSSITLLLACCIAAIGVYLVGNVQPRTFVATHRLRGSLWYRMLWLVCVALLLGGRWWQGVASAQATDAYTRAKAAAQHGDWSAAVAAITTSVELDPLSEFYLWQRAYALSMLAHEQGDFEPVLMAYSQAESSSPGYVAGQLNHAAVLLEAGDTSEAVYLLQAMTQRDPQWPLPRLLLGRAYAQQGNVRAARDQFTTLLHLDAAYARTSGCMSDSICAALKPTHSSNTDPLAKALEQLASGNAQSLKELAIGTDLPDLWLPLAETHLQRGEIAQARYALTASSVPSRFAQPGLFERYGLDFAHYYAQSGQPSLVLRGLQFGIGMQQDSLPYVFIYGKRSLADPLLPQVARLLDTPERAQIYREIARLASAQGDVVRATNARH